MYNIPIKHYANQNISINIFDPENRIYNNRYITDVAHIQFIGDKKFKANIVTGSPMPDGGTYGNADTKDVIFDLNTNKVKTLKNGPVKAINKRDMIESIKNLIMWDVVEWLEESKYEEYINTNNKY